MDILKCCTKCKQLKPNTEFTKHSYGRNGLRPKCKACRSIEGKEYRAKKGLYSTRAKLTEQQKTERKRRWCREYYQRQKDKGIKRPSKKLTKEQQHKYYLRHKERRKSDPQYNIAYNLRKRLNSAVKQQNKAGSAVRDLGCSIAEFKEYIEKQFQLGMTWDNHGQWHFDHIKPLSKFDLNNKEQIKIACHYTNIQPLWAHDNLSKSNH